MRSAGLASVCLLIASSAYAELSLTPRLSSYELEGIRFPQLAFTDDKQEVTYSPPRDWEYSGSASRLTLHPKNKPQAEAIISRQPMPEPVPFDEEVMKKLADEALASVPEGSTEVKLLSQEKSPVAIEGKETFLVTMSYTFYGDTYGRSLMFMNRGKEQLRFQLSSRLVDFKELQQAFFASHFSWQNL